MAAALTLFLPPLSIFAVGVFLFVRSRELAGWLLPLPPETDEASLPPYPLAAASLAFAVVGVFIFLYAIPQALSYAISFIQIGDARNRELQFSIDAPRMIAVAVQLGFLLFIDSRMFAGVWWRKQRFGPRE